MGATRDNHDEELQKALAGSADAFSRLVEPHLSMLYAYSRALLGDHHAAEDNVQQTLMVAFRKRNNYFPEADFVGWLKAIAKREAYQVKRNQRRLTPVVEQVIESAYEDASPDPTSAELDALRQCLQRLQGQSKAVVVRHYFDRSEVRTIAASLNLKLNTVKSILHRARLELRKCVKQRLGRGPAS